MKLDWASHTRNGKQACMTAWPKITHAIETGIGKTHQGAQLTVFRRGRLLANVAFAERDPSETMLWMSAVKPLTATAIAQQIEVGSLELDTPVATHLPDFAANGKAAITIRHLLTHTGGFRNPTIDWDDEAPETAVQRICQTPLEEDWMPGETAGYHVDSSWTILGELVHQITGRSIQDVIREDILQPIGATHSGLGIPLAEQPEHTVAPVYRRSGNTLEPNRLLTSPDIIALARPGGNGRGPALDLARFYQALLDIHLGSDDAPPLLQANTLREFTRRHRTNTFDQTFRHTLDWCLGFIPDNNHHGANTVPYGYGPHCSPATFGHSGNQCAVAFADPTHELAVALLFDGMPGEPRHQRRVRAVLAALYEDLNLA